MKTQITYEFRAGTRAPANVTAYDVMSERDRIAKEYGEASIKLATAAVMSRPEDFPALRAFGPRDMEEAFEKSTAAAIRYAFDSVHRVRVVVEATPTSPPVRVSVRELVSVPGKNGPVYERFTVVAKNVDMRDHYLTECDRLIEQYTKKLREITTELRELGDWLMRSDAS